MNAEELREALETQDEVERMMPESPRQLRHVEIILNAARTIALPILEGLGEKIVWCEVHNEHQGDYDVPGECWWQFEYSKEPDCRMVERILIPIFVDA